MATRLSPFPIFAIMQGWQGIGQRLDWRFDRLVSRPLATSVFFLIFALTACLTIGYGGRAEGRAT